MKAVQVEKNTANKLKSEQISDVFTPKPWSRRYCLNTKTGRMNINRWNLIKIMVTNLIVNWFFILKKMKPGYWSRLNTHQMIVQWAVFVIVDVDKVFLLSNYICHSSDWFAENLLIQSGWGFYSYVGRHPVKRNLIVIPQKDTKGILPWFLLG